MARVNRVRKRTPLQAQADRGANDVALQLGKALRLQRRTRGMTQAQAAAIAGLSQSMWSHLEIGGAGGSTMAVWNRAAAALGGRLKAYIESASAADLPRDAVHLRNQELVMRSSEGGAWRALPELRLHGDARTSRMADLALVRGNEYGLCEVFDWFGRRRGGRTRLAPAPAGSRALRHRQDE